MGQAVKYGILAAALALIVVAIGAALAGFLNSDTLDGVRGSINNFITEASSTLRNVRAALNYVFGSALLSAAIPFYIAVPLGYIAIKITVGVYRWMNQ